MGLITFDELKEAYENNNEDVIAQTKAAAKDICDQRDAQLPNLVERKERLDAEVPKLQKSLSEIRGMLDKGFILDQGKMADINARIASLLENLAKYVDMTNLLVGRFENKKIRVISIGQKSMGKSLFTKLYTGLGDNLIKVKASTDVKDCTGTVNVFKHGGAGQNPVICVKFHTENEILGIINNYMSLIRGEVTNFRIEGKDRFDSMGDVRACCRKEIVEALNTYQASVNNELVNGLKSYFTNTEYIGCLGRQPITEINIDEIGKYNDMQWQNGVYQAVKEIEITADLGHDGLFEFFEIVDTKGISIQAGAQATRDILDEVDRSDAVFSLHRPSQEASSKILYNDVLLPKSNDDPTFRERHSIVVNLPQTFTYENAKPNIYELQNMNLADCLYIGKLRTATYTEGEADGPEPKEFVDLVILDMLHNIAENVQRLDNKKIDNCNCLASEIETKMRELVKELSGVDFTPVDKKQILCHKIGMFDQEYRKGISSKLGFMNEQYEQPNETEYETLVKNGETKSLYEMFTGKKHEREGNQGLGRESEEMACIVEAIYPELTGYAGGIAHDCVNEAGHYLDLIAKKLGDIYNRRVANELGQQQIQVDEERKIMYNQLWEVFRFKAILGGDTWNRDKLLAVGNDRLSDLVGYCDKKYTQNLILIPPCPVAYQILDAFFYKGVTPNKDEIEGVYHGTNTHGILCSNKDRLIETLTDLLSEMGLREAVETRVADKVRAIRNIWSGINAWLNSVDLSEQLYGFYAPNAGHVLTGDDLHKLELSEAWDVFETSRRSIEKTLGENILKMPLFQQDL